MWEKVNGNYEGYRLDINYPNKKSQFIILIYYDDWKKIYRIRCTEFELKTTSLKTDNLELAKKKALEIILNKIEEKEKIYIEFKKNILNVK